MEKDRESGRSISGQKASEGGRGDSNKASPVAIERYLKGIKYPIEKSALLAKAQENGAPDDVLYVLKQFTDKEYSSPIDVSKEVGHIE